MTIISPVFAHQEEIPAKYTCLGEQINPPLRFLDIPRTAKSLVLLVEDPDAVRGLFVHWVVFNMPVTVTEILENSRPQGIEGITSFGKPGYGSPCPPSGTGIHRYFFKLYALDSFLDLSSSADRQQILDAMEGHVLERVDLIGLFGK
jgi:Raf kinase inhibitor-like YbhB/YbcL family protein